MSDSSVTYALKTLSKIKKLNGPDDWEEWNRKLKGHLGLVDLWKVLTGERPAPVIGTAEHSTWQSYQQRLASLLLLITGPSAQSLIRLKGGKNATEKYNDLKSTYNKTTITTFFALYRRINRCSLSNHKSLKEYGDEVAIARNKLKALKRPVDELQVTCAFLDGLDSSYQVWKDMFLSSYATNPTKTENGVEVLIVPTIEEIVQLLIDRESRNSSSLSQMPASGAFSACKKKDNKDSSRPQVRGGESSNSQHHDRYCATCYSHAHNTSYCWFTHTEKANEKFKAAHPNADALKKALDEKRKANKEWDMAHPRWVL